MATTTRGRSTTAGPQQQSGQSANIELIIVKSFSASNRGAAGGLNEIPIWETSCLLCYLDELRRGITGDNDDRFLSIFRRHYGDLGNVVENAKGVVTETKTDRLVALSGTYSVIGRSVVVSLYSWDLFVFRIFRTPTPPEWGVMQGPWYVQPCLYNWAYKRSRAT